MPSRSVPRERATEAKAPPPPGPLPAVRALGSPQGADMDPEAELAQLLGYACDLQSRIQVFNLKDNASCFWKCVLFEILLSESVCFE